MASLQADIEEQGGSVALSTSITAGHVAGEAPDNWTSHSMSHTTLLL